MATRAQPAADPRGKRPSGSPGPGGARAEHAQQVREKILVVAAAHFRRYGYDRTSLAEIGAELGLTRGAVLYHFGTKPRLLTELLAPFTQGLQHALDEFESRPSPPPPRMVIDTVLDLLTATPPAVDLLARDIASRHALDLDAWFTGSSSRLVSLLAPGSGDDPASRARGYAALGAMIRPLANLPHPIDRATRQAVRRAAIGALGTRGSR